MSERRGGQTGREAWATAGLCSLSEGGRGFVIRVLTVSLDLKLDLDFQRDMSPPVRAIPRSTQSEIYISL